MSSGSCRPARREVVGDDARARREARLDVRGRAQAARDRVAREQAGGDHHRRVRRVGARRDRGDHDVAVVHGLAVARSRAAGRRRVKLAGTPASGTRSCGRRGPARLGSTAPRSSSTSVDEGRRRIAVAAEQALLLGVALDERHEIAAARRRAGSAASRRRPGRAPRWRRTPATCSRASRGRPARAPRGRRRRTRRSARRRRACAASRSA